MQAKWRSGMVATDDYAEPIANLLRTIDTPLNRATCSPRTWQRSKMLLSRFQLDRAEGPTSTPNITNALDNLQA